MEWTTDYQSEQVDETFFSRLDHGDHEYHQSDYDSYDGFRRGCLEEMRDALLEYISLPQEAGAEVAQASSLFHIPEIGFIDDQRLREVCRGYLESARICEKRKLHLPAVVLVASALEGILFSLANQRKDKWMGLSEIPSSIVRKDAHKLSLADLLLVGRRGGWVSEEEVPVAGGSPRIGGAAGLGNLLNDSRNHLHPARQVRADVTYEEHDFNIAWSVVQKIASDIRRWLEREMERDPIEDSVSKSASDGEQNEESQL